MLKKNHKDYVEIFLLLADVAVLSRLFFLSFLKCLHMDVTQPDHSFAALLPSICQ